MKSDKPYFLWIELAALFLGILGMFLPYMSATSFYGAGEISLLTGDLKPLAYIGIGLMLITAIIQYFKPQWWLIAPCVGFAIIPWISTMGLEDAGQVFAVAKRESGAYLSLFSSVILTICFIIEFCVYIRHMNRPHRLLYIGIEFFIMGALVMWLCPSIDIIGAVLMMIAAPVFIFLSILGFIFAKKHKPEVIDTESSISIATDDVISKKQGYADRKIIIWLVAGLVAWILILLGIRSISPSEEDLKNYKEVVTDEAPVYSNEEDVENGVEPIAIIKRGDKVEVRFVDEPWVVMRYNDKETGKLIKGFMRYEDLDFSGDGQSDDMNSMLTNQTNKDDNPTPDMTLEETEEYERIEMEAENDWDATTSVDWEGTINGKWKIEMTVHRLDGMVWGSYCYTKNKTDISLDGQWGENGQLTLTESVDGNVTGQFIGTYGEDSFNGIWVSADGEKEYPFTLKPVYKVEP